MAIPSKPRTPRTSRVKPKSERKATEVELPFEERPVEQRNGEPHLRTILEYFHSKNIAPGKIAILVLPQLKIILEIKLKEQQLIALKGKTNIHYTEVAEHKEFIAETESDLTILHKKLQINTLTRLLHQLLFNGNEETEFHKFYKKAEIYFRGKLSPELILMVALVDYKGRDNLKILELIDHLKTIDPKLQSTTETTEQAKEEKGPLGF